MRLRKIWIATFAVAVAGLALGAQEASPRPAAPAVVVGTFDSRAVAVAWGRSKGFAALLSGLRAEQEQARAAGDLERVAALDARGAALQEELHRQAFSTAPVDGVVARVADALPEIAREAGVDVIVSRWALAWRSDGARFVDVTERMVAAFEPDAATQEAIRQLVSQDPLPPERLQRRED